MQMPCEIEAMKLCSKAKNSCMQICGYTIPKSRLHPKEHNLHSKMQNKGPQRHQKQLWSHGSACVTTLQLGESEGMPHLQEIFFRIGREGSGKLHIQA